ncbi:MAG: hypothetical protein SOZ80_04190 [Prevotella sp.]|uniref:hypothetical protein n=1 Tax=Prevotella sp. TaxID=59823 RepID=UPI002A332A2E|nr:hypothetical protein [Prevotella sp.]MDD7318935.1 hypothetical protein [Prevotellaceae bacterium]MDY4019961.1 hypothetical protein [Prevotella sp.]
MKRYVIMGDEYLTSLEIKEVVRQLRPDYNLLCIIEDMDTSAEYLNRHDVDLIIADVELSDGSSADAIRRSNNRLTPVIFATPYRKGNPKHSDMNVIDYLTKPISDAALLDSMVKFETRLTKQDKCNN